MSIHIKNNQYYLGFSYFVKIGPAKMKRLIDFFPDPEKAFWASWPDLEKAGLPSNLTKEFIVWRKKFSLTTALEELEKEKINFIDWSDSNYPALLKEISSPPYILYYQGSLTDSLKTQNQKNQRPKNYLAIVGSRQPSAYASKIIEELLPPLIKEKIEIISGLAVGVDSLAHRTALDCGGRTIAVLGSGLKKTNFYPYANISLAEEIIKSGGALISEFPPDTPPRRENFPQRNRIISGLAHATLIIEAKRKSGALITANYALEQNREVMAVPGNIFSELSSGTNSLIKNGAKTITDSQDILDFFKVESYPAGNQRKTKKRGSFSPENETEKIIYETLKQAEERGDQVSADDLIRQTELDTATINSTLSILEIRGIIKNRGANYELISG